MKKNSLKNYKVDESSKRGVKYVGVYYNIAMPTEQRRRNGLLQIAAGFAEILLIFIAISINCMGNRTFYVIIPLECILFCAIYYIRGAYALYRSEEWMEQKTFDRAVDNPIQVAAVALILNIISCLGQIFLIIRKHSVLIGKGDYILLVCVFIILALHIYMWLFQRRLHSIEKKVK